MSALDYRRIETVQCAGISIATFLRDDRQTIMVSVSDLVDELSLNLTDLADMEGVYEYVLYDSIGRQSTHLCIQHVDINEFLWMHDCKESSACNLDEFRKFFLYEVMSFWNRFAPAAASLSVRDAIKVVDRKTSEYHDKLGIPPGRVYQMAFEALGYDRVPHKDNLTTEELSFVAFAELLYASVAASEQADGCDTGDSMRIADGRLERPLRELGRVTRGVGGV